MCNEWITTKYFKLEKGVRQADPVSAYLFALCSDILFMLIKNNKNIRIFGNTFLYTAYADDKTFFLKDKNSIKELLNTVNYFSTFTGLKPNLCKCEVTGVGPLKGVKVATLIENTFGECLIFCSNLRNLSLNSFPDFYINIFRSWKTLLLFSHLLQVESDLSFCGFIKMLNIITNHVIVWISRKRISILLNMYANRLEFFKAGVK